MRAPITPGAVVLGLGGTVDYELVWDSAVLERMAADAAIEVEELAGPDVIGSKRDLIRSVLTFLAAGTGGERYVADAEIIEAFAAHFDVRVTLGGTCVRAALAMDRLGVPSTVHLVSINDHVRTLLPDGMRYVCSATEDSTDPHLIVQFPQDARLRVGDLDVRALNANRLIYVHDPANRDMRLSRELPAALSSASCFLISGFNSMQNAAELDRRLDELIGHMTALPSSAFVMYEDAGYHVPDLSRRVRDRLAGTVDVYSMNEDELQWHVGRAVDLLDADEVAAALTDLRAVVPARTLVVHTARWAVAVGADAAAYEDAVRGGAAAAGARYLHGDVFTEADYRVVLRGPVHPAGAALAARLAEVMADEVVAGELRCVPGNDLRPTTPTMVGLGDTFVGGFLAVVAADAAAEPGRPRQEAAR